MKNLFIIAFVLTSTLTYAQKTLLDSASLAQKPEFVGLESALETPLEVHKLQFSTAVSIVRSSRRELKVSNTKDITLFKEIDKLKNLQELKVSKCDNLTALPKEIGSLVNLQKLALFANKNLVTIPSEIGKLKNLKELSFVDCSKLTFLPKEIGNLIGLEILDLDGSENMTTIPIEIGKLKNLKSVRLFQTKISQEDKNKFKKMLPNCKFFD